MSRVSWAGIIKRLGTLALIELDQTKAETLSHDLEKIIEMFDEIAELGVPEEVEPLYTTFFGEANLRDDEESESTGIEGLDPSGERLEGGFLKSPKTL